MHGGEVAVQGNISSQFISALLMIGPVLPGGLRLELLGKINSRPYIEMTLDLMHYFGVSAHWEENVIVVKEQPYVAKAYTIESDWSAASYWYAIAALVPEADLFIRGLRKYSRQGDCRIADLMEPFGVKTTFKEEGIHLTRIPAASPQEVLEIDFTTTPDLAQTMAVVSAATGISLRMTGLETLRIKETDRILALQNELGKFGISMAEVEPEVFQVTGTFTSSATPIETYEDHRMAMAFAPLALSQSDPLYIKEPDVVVKSYPEFWEHLELVGLIIRNGNMKTLIIGAGNMGLTYAQNFINSNLLTKDHLFFLERTIEKFPLLQPYSHNELMTDPSPLVREMDMIILSVKPQDFPSLAPTLQDYLHPDQLIISIMAGIQIHHIQESLGIPKVIRAMPNLPAQVGMGMTVFTTSQEVSKKDFFIAQNLLSTTGKALYTTDENYLDAATAISGSGPAYVFFFMNSLIKTAKIMGFSEAEAQLLVQQTFLGSFIY